MNENILRCESTYTFNLWINIDIVFNNELLMWKEIESKIDFYIIMNKIMMYLHPINNNIIHRILF